ncbi:MAG: hypothetical protein R3B90_08460 [Planctomycetaceae bacterium]
MPTSVWLSTELFDRIKKFRQYLPIESLQGYLLASEDEALLELYSRDDNGHWVLSDATNGELDIPAVGCSLSVADVYAQIELPPTNELRVDTEPEGP